MIRDILTRFKQRLLNGDYDNKDILLPLLTSDEINYIEAEIDNAAQAQEKKYTEERKIRLKKAASLVQKYPEEKELFETY